MSKTPSFEQAELVGVCDQRASAIEELISSYQNNTEIDFVPIGSFQSMIFLASIALIDGEIEGPKAKHLRIADTLIHHSA